MPYYFVVPIWLAHPICFRYGFISLQDCLHEKLWTAENFISNIAHLDSLTKKNNPFVQPGKGGAIHLKPLNVST